MELFHVSRKDLGPEVTLKPRAGWQGKAIGEDTKIPRISVATSIENCLRGITWVKAPKVAWVYKLKGRARGIDWDSPRDLVPDWEITEEVWLREPNRFQRVGAIRIDTATWMDEGFPVWRWAVEPNACPPERKSRRGGSMSKKDYVLIANSIASAREEARKNNASESAFTALGYLTGVLAAELKYDNPSFNKKMFLKACQGRPKTIL